MKIYGDKIRPACSYCEHGARINVTGQISCVKRGIVADDYACRKFSYDPTKRIPPKKMALPSYDKSDFELS